LNMVYSFTLCLSQSFTWFAYWVLRLNTTIHVMLGSAERFCLCCHWFIIAHIMVSEAVLTWIISLSQVVWLLQLIFVGVCVCVRTCACLMMSAMLFLIFIPKW
jgi:hypothetical protein